MTSRRFLSSPALVSASRFIRSTSSLLRPPDFSTVVLDSLPVALSLALTLRMPLTSMLNVTSICGWPRAAGGMPPRLNVPSKRLSLANSRSPWRTLIVTSGWLSAAVLNVSLLLVGIVVLRGIRTVITPPCVSTPRLSGVASRTRMSFTSPLAIPPWMAAPMATTSSGLTLRFGSLPLNRSLTIFWTIGTRVLPPTRTTSSTFSGGSLASLRASSRGFLHFSTSGPISCSNLVRVTVICRCLGPDWSAVMNGRLTVVSIAPLSSILAFSAASLSRWRAIGSLRRSIPSVRLKSSARKLIRTWSKSSPPRWVSPLMERTSKTPSPTSRTDTSNVPPPRSKTQIFSFFFLSSPYASAAAVGSGSTRRTFSPAISPASLVAFRWASLK